MAHEDLFMKIGIKEGRLSISGVSVHAAGGHESKDNPEGATKSHDL
jgi:hypothetical protein